MRETLRKMKGLRSAVWVVSPLQRTIQTFMRACPYYADLLQGAASHAVTSPAEPSCSSLTLPEIVIMR